MSFLRYALPAIAAAQTALGECNVNIPSDLACFCSFAAFDGVGSGGDATCR